MNKQQALYVATKVMKNVADTQFFNENEENALEKKLGVSHAEVVNALPIIEAMEVVEGAS